LVWRASNSLRWFSVRSWGVLRLRWWCSAWLVESYVWLVRKKHFNFLERKLSWIEMDWYGLWWIEVDWGWLRWIEMDWGWLRLIAVNWGWLRLIERNLFYLRWIEVDWGWLRLIEVDWGWI
jgi:hypothetical protein